MRILFITDNFPPEVNAPATRTYEHCREWVDKGVKVTVITCFPNFPKGKVFEGYKNKLYQVDHIDGIKVIRVWSYISANSGFVKRILDFISFAIMAFFVGLFQKTDLIIGTSPQFFTAVSARLLSFFKFRPWCMEVRDLWPESIVAVGAMKKESFAFKFLHKLEKHLYKSARIIIVVTDSFKKYIVELGIHERKISVIKNGVDSSKFKPRAKDKVLLSEYNLNEKFVIGYIGTHGMAHALDFILDCLPKIKDENVHVLFQGDGANKVTLQEKASQMELTNITFLPFVPKSEIVRYISLLDVALVNLKKSDTFKTVIPSKIFENACMQKPILLGVEGESKTIIEKYDAGISFEPENIDSFLIAVDEIKNTDNYKRLQYGCSKLAIDFERSTLAQNMLNLLNSNHK